MAANSNALKKGGALAITSQALKLALQLGTIAVLARLVPPSDFGLVSLVTPIVAFFYVFRDIGLGAATVYVEDLTDPEITSLFWINALAGAVLAALLALAAPLAAVFYQDPRLTTALACMALTFVCNGASAQYLALFQRRLQFKALFAIDVIANVSGAVLGLFTALAGYGYWALIVMPIVTQLMTLIVSSVLSKWHPGWPRWEPRTWMMVKFGSEISGFNLLNYFSRNVDNLLIGRVWGLEQLGFYGRAYSLMMAPLTQVIYPLNQVVVPVLTRANSDPAAYISAYLGVMRTVMLLCVPLVTWILVSREWVVAILLGANWGAVVPMFLALGFSAFVQPMNNSAGWLMLSQGRSRDVFWWGVIGSAITVGSILLGLKWGALWVAVSYSAFQIVIVTPLLWWFACRKGFVRMSHLLTAAAPLWIVCGVAGLSFEAGKDRIFGDALASCTPFACILVALVWVVSISSLLLASHPGGRAILADSAREVAKILRRRAPAPVSGV